jgi:phospholipase/lecithinase/hemolysin
MRGSIMKSKWTMGRFKAFGRTPYGIGFANGFAATFATIVLPMSLLYECHQDRLCDRIEELQTQNPTATLNDFHAQGCEIGIGNCTDSIEVRASSYPTQYPK